MKNIFPYSPKTVWKESSCLYSEILFQGNKDLFKGLATDKLEKEWKEYLLAESQYQDSLLIAHCGTGFQPAVRSMTIIRRQMLTHFPTVTQSAGFQPEALLITHHSSLITHYSLL